MTQHNYGALYFPFSKCFDSYTLKRALLYYDKIYFMDPFTLEQSEHLLETSHYYNSIAAPKREDFLAFMREVYYYLEDQGAIVNADIYPLIKQYDRELTTNTLQDVSDDLFVKYSYGDCYTNEEKVCWHVMERRMPPSLVQTMNRANWDTFRHGVAKSAVIYTDIIEGDWISFVDEFRQLKKQREVLRKKPTYCNAYVPVNIVPRQDFTKRWEYNNDRRMPLPDSGYIVPYGYGASISITQAMLYAAQNDLTLFTDSETMYYLLARKCQMAFEKSEQVIEKYRQYELLLRKVKENDIVVNVVDSVIHPAYLEKLDFGQVLRLREAGAEQLEEFRAYLAEINTLSTAPWEKGYVEEVEQLVSRIERKVRELQTELSNTYQKIFRDTLKTVAGVGLGIAIMPHNLTIGAVLALLAAKDTPLDAIFKLWEAEASTRKYSVSYLLSIKKTERGGRPWERARRMLIEPFYDR